MPKRKPSCSLHIRGFSDIDGWLTRASDELRSTGLRDLGHPSGSTADLLTPQRARIATLATRGSGTNRSAESSASRHGPCLRTCSGFPQGQRHDQGPPTRRTLSQRPAPAETATNETSTVTNTAVHIHRAVHPCVQQPLGPTTARARRRVGRSKPNLRSRRAEPARQVYDQVDEQGYKKLTLAQIAAEFDVVSRRSTATPDENAPPARLVP